MNKKVKSLLVSGLLVFSMTGGVFAEETELQKQATIKIENPKFEEGKRVVEFQGGLIKLELTEKDNGDVDIKVLWHAESIKILGVRSYYENEENAEDKGYIDHTNYFEELYYCNTLVKEGEFYTGTVLGGISGKKLIRVEIDYENLIKSSNPVTPNPTPTEKITDPDTGDTSIMPIVATAVISAAGLYVINKKDDEE